MGKENQPEYEGFLERLGKRLDNMNIWYKRLAGLAVILAAIWGGCVGVANTLAQTLDSHIDDQLSDVVSSVKDNTKSLREIRLDTLRTQLLLYIYHEPHEHHTILEIAKVYFVDYGGDWIMTNKFKQWAKEEGVEIPFELNH